MTDLDAGNWEQVGWEVTCPVTYITMLVGRDGLKPVPERTLYGMTEPIPVNAQTEPVFVRRKKP